MPDDNQLSSSPIRRVLSIDGGGIKGVLPASILATVEDSLGHSVANYFDLIVGTSTGGIIALGLGLGLSAREILGFYEDHGPRIFFGNPLLRSLRNLGYSKYGSDPLRKALRGVFGQRKLGESRKRLVIPSLNLDTGRVHIWKTAHHVSLERDYKEEVVTVALATAAAPTYFPTHRSAAGSPLVDGGMWANNPIAVAVVESLGILGWPAESLRVLSLGCSATPLDVRLGRRLSRGRAYWAFRIVDVFMSGQSSAALGMAQHLVPDRSAIIRVDPMVSSRFSLDGCNEIDSLKGLGDTEARSALPQLRRHILVQPAADPFVPFYGSDLQQPSGSSKAHQA